MNQNIEGPPTGGTELIELTPLAGPAPLIPTSPEDAHTILIEYIQGLEFPENFEEIVFARPHEGNGVDGQNVPQQLRDIMEEALRELGNSLKRLEDFSKNEACQVDRQPVTGSTILGKLFSTLVFTEERAAAATLVDCFTAITIDYGHVMRTWVDFAQETQVLVNAAFQSTTQTREGSTALSQERINEALGKKYDESEGLINALVTLEKGLSELISSISDAEAVACSIHTDAKTSKNLLSTENFRRSLRVIGILPVIGAAIGVGAVHTNNDQILKLGSLVSSGLLAFLYGSVWRERLHAYRTADRDTIKVLKELTNQVRDGSSSLHESIKSYTTIIRAKRELLKTELLGDDLEVRRRWEDIAKEYEELYDHAKKVQTLFTEFHLWDQFPSLIPFLGTVEVSKLEVQGGLD
ncbi:hypothetical protein M407DRAFT_19606 [Tulasnella calospora MUT 4182]|uniref:Uncharacterized protein n=1 Tax=Tulasnella calospora MUT 4182 TaxID=1051891 RepID=A0A0C3QRR2_9AGAM|nr:hypothetical protein M407DRAFT_19606 [Tulasnella calospora MUT 4182]